MSVFEVLMLVCFGCAWPTSIYKSLKSKSVKGKSVLFLYIILLGYVFGMLHKAFYNFDLIIYLYLLNFLMVFTDLMLYYRNLRLSKKDMV
ncbi:hypothetical protein CI105_03685 [Candidatus Izimaplasma bacterium ZiA1]|uniref:hypothetical protein n=1 Tax=Candidatus Izimoplasma sp. ZiA1 TaxID=2024899 RepID=UPI000BAA9093|nr:hypothetical protein CI105_03685 [Candidatus Izimaplasma bacterium ZiA1]